MSIRNSISLTVQSCDNFAIDTHAAVTLDAKRYPWTARVSSDIMVHIKLQPRDGERDGTLVFSAAATVGDIVSILSEHGEVDFVFGDGTGGTVDVGADISPTAAQSAQNLKAAIQSYIDDFDLDLTVTGGAATLSFVTHDPFIHLEEVVDSMNVMTVTELDYTSVATSADAPFTEFRDLLFAVSAGETLSFIGGEDSGLCSVSEVKLSSA